jgi:hypothetical protein
MMKLFRVSSVGATRPHLLHCAAQLSHTTRIPTCCVGNAPTGLQAVLQAAYDAVLVLVRATSLSSVHECGHHDRSP